METKTTGQQQQQRNAKTLALPAPQQRLRRGIVIMAQATRAAVVALFLFLFLFLRTMGSFCPISSGHGYWRDGHLRCCGHLCWRRCPTSGDKDGWTTTTTTQRRLRCQCRDDNGNATAKRHCSHGAGNASVVAYHFGASAATMTATKLQNDNACIAGAAPTRATLWQRYGNATTLVLLALPTMVMQQQHNRNACVASAARIMAKQ